MSFSWAWLLLGLLLLPILAFIYLRVQSRPAEGVVLHPDAEFLRQIAQKPFSKGRDLPTFLFLLAFGFGIVALARPHAPVPVPDNRTTIILTLDVSLSMDARDILPTRFSAAQEAARVFIKQLPKGTKVGLVSFAGYAAVNILPTDEHGEVLKAIDELSLGRGTAIGAGIRESVGSLPGRSVDGQTKLEKNPPPVAVVLLTDGRNNREPDPIEMATLAKEQQVKVYTVGLGTQQGMITLESGGFLVGFDPETLKQIAQITGGQYFEARSAGQLEAVYKSLGRSIGWTTRLGEVTHLAAALAGIFLFISLAAGELNRRVV
ncbi:MAG: VWA domain-containing protein [Deinococcales bacterium]